MTDRRAAVLCKIHISNTGKVWFSRCKKKKKCRSLKRTQSKKKMFPQHFHNLKCSSADQVLKAYLPSIQLSSLESSRTPLGFVPKLWPRARAGAGGEWGRRRRLSL